MDTSFLSDTSLFRGVTPGEIAEMLPCLGAVEKHLPKGAQLYRVGDRTQRLGLVLQGAVSIEKSDLWGNRTILDSIRPGQLFAESYACTGEMLLVDVVTDVDSDVLLIDVERLLKPCSSACAHHSRLVRNLLAISSQKNLRLIRRSFCTAPHSLRARLLAYLSDQAEQSGSRTFDIPFDRQQLADYLNVDRSALSGELSRLRREGVLQSTRSHFTLLSQPQAASCGREDAP